MGETLGDRLKAARITKGMSQQAVADAVGVNRVRVSNWETNQHKPGATNLDALAALFGTTSRALLYGKEDAKPARNDIVSRDTYAAVDRSAPRHARNLPLAVREYLAEFRLRLTKADVPEEQIEEAMRLLKSPDVFSYFKGGRPTEYNEEDVLNGMRAIGEDVIIPRLRKLGRKVK